MRLALETRFWPNLLLTLGSTKDVMSLVTFAEDDIYLILHLLKRESRILPLSSPGEGVCWRTAAKSF